MQPRAAQRGRARGRVILSGAVVTATTALGVGALAAGSAPPAGAAPQPHGGGAGAAAHRLAPSSGTKVPPPLRKLSSFKVDGGYVAAGVAMRNLGHGTIHLTALPTGAKVVRAFLDWDILATSSTSIAGGTFDGHSIIGTLIGQGGSPCWAPAANYSFQANVTSFVTGNGTYVLTDFPSGVTTGVTPQVESTAPMSEGATLVVVYRDTASPSEEVVIDGGATENGSALIYKQSIGKFTVATQHAATTFIVSDGQGYADTGATFNGAKVVTTFTGHTHMTNATYSRYPGAATTGLGGGNFWDTDTVTVSSLVAPGATSVKAALGGETYDCLVWVGQVFSTTIPLAAPTNVTATAGPHHVALAWAKVPLATGYEVFASTTPTGENLTGTPACTTKYRTCRVKGLKAGTPYYFEVVATAATVVSPPSSQVSAVPTA